MVPVVEPRTEDDHRLALRLFRVVGEVARGRDDLIARNAGDLFRPGRGKRHVVVERGCCVSAEALIDPVMGDDKVVDGGDERVTVLQLELLHGDVAAKHVAMRGTCEIRALRARTEIGEVDPDNRIAAVNQAQRQVDFAVLAIALFQVPFALVTPAKSDRTQRGDDVAGALVIGDRLPFGIVGFIEGAIEIGGSDEAFRDIAVAALHQPHEHRHVGVFAAIIAEIFRMPVDVEFLQHDMAERHRQRTVGALLGCHPQIGELRRFRIVRANDHRLRALVPDLGVEVRVGRARLRDVRTPQHQEGRIVPVGAFGDIGLLAPGLRARRRKIAIPVVEA